MQPHDAPLGRQLDHLDGDLHHVADFDRPVLGDRYAKEAVDRIDFDWDGLKAPGSWAPLVTVRTAQYDIWARQFLAVS